MNIIDSVVKAFVTIVAIFLIYLVFAWLPMHVINEQNCLEKGYANHKVTLNLTKYCINLYGSLTTVVTNK